MMLRLLSTLLLMLILATSLFSQENRRILAYYGLIDSEFIRFTTLDGAGGYSNSNSYELGLNYSQGITDKIAIETGVNLIHSDVIISFNDPRNEDEQETIDLVSIPIAINLALKKNFYLNAGITLDFQNMDKSYDKQSGIGGYIGIGKRIYLEKFFFDINPFIAMHSAIPFQKENYHQRLVRVGVKLGVGYQL